LIIFTFVFCLHILNFAQIKNYIIGTVVLFFSYNFYNYSNLYKTATWYFDAHTEEILRELNKFGKQSNTVQKIDFSWPFQSSIEYYLKMGDLDYLDDVKDHFNRELINEEADFYIYLDRPLNKVGYIHKDQKIHKLNKKKVKVYPKEYIYLYSIGEE